MKLVYWSLSLVSLLVVLFAPTSAHASPAISFDSFNGQYFLSRDSRGLSLLTTKETILADFGNGGFSGITRQIPTTFQGHSVDVKILSVSDTAGSPISYKTSNNGSFIVLTTGDPSIVLYGQQTININYQTSGVINLSNKSDEFLLDVNGRGWDEAFNNVFATLYIPNNFKASLLNQPSCYVALGTNKTANCQLSTKNSSGSEVISTQASNLAPHQTLGLKVDFKTATFTNKKTKLPNILIIIGAALVIIMVVLYLIGLKVKGIKK